MMPNKDETVVLDLSRLTAGDDRNDDDDNNDEDGGDGGDSEGKKLTGGSENGGLDDNNSKLKKEKTKMAGPKFRLPDWLWSRRKPDASSPVANGAGDGAQDPAARRHAKNRGLVCGMVVVLLVFLLIVIIGVGVAFFRHSTSSSSLPPNTTTAGFGGGTPGGEEEVFFGTDIVTTPCGKVKGRARDGGFEYLGIPYATPPIDAKRWTHSWSTEDCPVTWHNLTFKDVTMPSPQCLHVQQNGSLAGSEDCLTLDIHTPRLGRRARLPIIVLITAETLDKPSDLSPIINLSKVAAKHSVVLVVPKFRLSALGFLALGELSRESVSKKASGNYGLGDVVQALKWVQAHARSFGADAGRVTLVGHLAGGSIVTALTAVELTEDMGVSNGTKLFHGAWVASGGGQFTSDALYIAETVNVLLRQKLQCDGTAACMRTRDAGAVLKAVPDNRRRLWYSMPPEDDGKLRRSWLIPDGLLLKTMPPKAWANDGGLKQNVPIIFGTTRHAELRSWTPQTSTPPTSEIFSLNTTLLIRDRVTQDFSDFDDQVRATALRYISSTSSDSLTNSEDPRARYFALLTAIRTKCPLKKLAGQLANITATNDNASSPSKFPIRFYELVVAATSTKRDVGFETVDAFADLEVMLSVSGSKSPIQEAFFDFVKRGVVFGGDSQFLAGVFNPQFEVGGVVDGCEAFLNSTQLYPYFARMD